MIVVTGVGPLCALGADVSSVWRSVLGRRSGIERVLGLDGAAVPIGSRVPDETLEEADPRERRQDRVVRLALQASRAGLLAAGLLDDERRYAGRSERAGLILGTSRGAAGLLEHNHERFIEKGSRGVGPHASPLSTTGGLSASVARQLGLRGPNLTVSAACSSASQAIGMAFDQLRLGRADVMVAGGAEACLTPFCMAMFDAAGILSHRVDEPARACRPFDRGRDGTVVGEGAGVLVLETLVHARGRGATPLARMAGFGASCDAHSLTGMPESGEGLVRAARAALDDAGIGADSLGAIGAHGTGTRLGDRVEATAYHNFLGHALRRTPIVTIKALVGHLLGAAGAIEAVCAVQALASGVLPPAANLEDPELDLDLIRDVPRTLERPWMLTCSMGFGGNNACLVFGPVPHRGHA